jgi:excisionase family DNA binding protein
MPEPDHIGAQEAAKLLKVGPRMVYRYGEDGKLRTIRAGRRILFNRVDVLALADETAVESKPEPQSTALRADDMLGLVREQQQKLEAAALELGDLRARLEQRPLLTDLDTLKDRVHELERENDRLRFDLERERDKQPVEPQPPAVPPKPWWRRILG